MIKTAMIGCGNIGSQTAQFIDKNHNNILRLEYLVDIDENNLANLKNNLKNNLPKKTDLKKAIENAELIIECAHPDVVKEIVNLENFDSGKKFIFISTGGLIDYAEKINNLKKSKVFFPSGAISGLDAIRAVGKDLEFLSLTTTKKPKGLSGAPFITQNNIQISENARQEIFSGNLNDAINGFPKNINVGATLFLATNFKNINIKIISDPNCQENVHEIIARGKFGEIRTTTKNKPSINPKTSQLAIYSLFNLIDNIVPFLDIGDHDLYK